MKMPHSSLHLLMLGPRELKGVGQEGALDTILEVSGPPKLPFFSTPGFPA